MAVGESSLTFQLIPNWEQLPEGWTHGDVAGVATDSQDRVYVFNRSEHPVIVYDRDGTFLSSLGRRRLHPPARHHHPRRHRVLRRRHRSHRPRLYPRRPGAADPRHRRTRRAIPATRPKGPTNLLSITRGGGPFNGPRACRSRPTASSTSPMAMATRASTASPPTAAHIQSWGEPGTEPGQFNLPHSVWVHTDGRVFVCDRENDRIQIFSPSGEVPRHLDQRHAAGRPVHRRLEQRRTSARWPGRWRHQHGRQALRPRRARHSSACATSTATVLTSWGGPDPCAPGSFASPHGLWVDSHGDLYVAEVTHTALSRDNRWHSGCHSLQKFARV